MSKVEEHTTGMAEFVTPKEGSSSWHVVEGTDEAIPNDPQGAATFVSPPRGPVETQSSVSEPPKSRSKKAQQWKDRLAKKGKKDGEEAAASTALEDESETDATDERKDSATRDEKGEVPSKAQKWKDRLATKKKQGRQQDEEIMNAAEAAMLVLGSSSFSELAAKRTADEAAKKAARDEAQRKALEEENERIAALEEEARVETIAQQPQPREPRAILAAEAETELVTALEEESRLEEFAREQEQQPSDPAGSRSVSFDNLPSTSSPGNNNEFEPSPKPRGLSSRAISTDSALIPEETFENEFVEASEQQPQDRSNSRDSICIPEEFFENEFDDDNDMSMTHQQPKRRNSQDSTGSFVPDEAFQNEFDDDDRPPLEDKSQNAESTYPTLPPMPDAAAQPSMVDRLAAETSPVDDPDDYSKDAEGSSAKDFPSNVYTQNIVTLGVLAFAVVAGMLLATGSRRRP
jgi:hypothetical protein